MNPFLDFLKKHWRLVAEIVVVLLCLIIGRYTAPKPQIQIQEREVTKEVKVVDEQMVEAEVTKRVAEVVKNLKTHTTTIVVTKKDGTKVEKTTSDTESQEKTKTEDQKVVTQVVTKTEYVDRVVEKQVQVKVETPKPQWLLGPEALMTFNGPSANALVPQPGQIYVGVGVDRRVAGPFFLGGTAAVGFNPFHGGGGTPSGFAVGVHLKAEW